jgi:hypothetical protein
MAAAMRLGLLLAAAWSGPAAGIGFEPLNPSDAGTRPGGEDPSTASGRDAPIPWSEMERFFAPPEEFRGKLGDLRPLLEFDDGSPVETGQEWSQRRQEILSSSLALSRRADPGRAASGLARGTRRSPRHGCCGSSRSRIFGARGAIPGSVEKAPGPSGGHSE